MDATQLLINDHNKVKSLFQQIEQGANPDQAKKLFEQIYHELTVHAIVEEQVFYPALAKFPDFTSLLKDAYKEHAEAKLQMGAIATLDSGSEEWKQKVKKLQGDIDHHVKDEEEKMFPKVRQVVGERLLNEIGNELQQAKTSKLDSPLLSQPNPFAQGLDTQQYAQ